MELQHVRATLRGMLCFWVLTGIVVALIAVPTTPGAAITPNQSITQITGHPSVQVQVLSIDQARLTAQIRIAMLLENPYIGSNFTVAVVGNGAVSVTLNSTKPNLPGESVFYIGFSPITQWGMYGSGEAYPFDHYVMNFTVGLAEPNLPASIIIVRQSNVLQPDSSESFGMLADQSLASTWSTHSYLDLPSNVSGNTLSVTLQRKPLTGLPLVLATFASYAFLGFSLFVRPEKKLSDRLTVCTSIFILVLGLYFGLGAVLPNRSGFALLEVLFLGLIASSAIIGCSTFVSNAFPKKAIYFDRVAVMLSGAVVEAMIAIGFFTSLTFAREFFSLNVGLWMMCAVPTVLLIVPGEASIRLRSKLK